MDHGKNFKKSRSDFNAWPSFDLDLADHRKDETVENKARFFGSMVGIDERQLHDQLGWEVYGEHDDVITGENN